MLVKGEGKQTSLSRLNRNRNKSVGYEDMKLILLINHREHHDYNEEERRYTICKEQA